MGRTLRLAPLPVTRDSMPDLNLRTCALPSLRALPPPRAEMPRRRLRGQGWRWTVTRSRGKSCTLTRPVERMPTGAERWKDRGANDALGDALLRLRRHRAHLLRVLLALFPTSRHCKVLGDAATSRPRHVRGLWYSATSRLHTIANLALIRSAPSPSASRPMAGGAGHTSRTPMRCLTQNHDPAAPATQRKVPAAKAPKIAAACPPSRSALFLQLSPFPLPQPWAALLPSASTALGLCGLWRRSCSAAGRLAGPCGAPPDCTRVPRLAAPMHNAPPLHRP